MHCILCRAFQHFTDFTFKWFHYVSLMFIDPIYEILRPLSPPHHLHQTPSLCPFRADVVLLQIKVQQSGVLLERLGQGLTGDKWLEKRDEAQRTHSKTMLYVIVQSSCHLKIQVSGNKTKWINIKSLEGSKPTGLEMLSYNPFQIPFSICLTSLYFQVAVPW